MLEYQFESKVLCQIKKSLTFPEMGGILGINEQRIVTKYHFDSTGITTESRYTPDVEALNKVICEWAKAKIEFIGFVHSHPKSESRLSSGDITYARRIKEACMIPKILMVIYIPGENMLHQYVL
ncbi:Mov34/MPN/PAD-1 family protein [Desulfovibrio sp. ZJ200]|uniref:Mov34/MPN/PAD-1 family protein n=1 Tax=Desulfovibrio sp. ZJ200 TaxID=2709792 RepID=UPI0013EB3801|nr:Mov34/MPN/PAD-1 family protein [Desulfovibrio sp. ZJ200]